MSDEDILVQQLVTAAFCKSILELAMQILRVDFNVCRPRVT